MVAAVIEDHAEIHYRIAGQIAALCRFNDSLFHGRNVVLGNGATENVINKLTLLAALQRLHFDFAVAILAVAAALLFVASLYVCLATNGFTVRNLRCFQQNFSMVALLEL